MKTTTSPRVVRYALYARTATGGREPVDAQLAALRSAVARRADGDVVREHADIDVPSGTGPGLAALLREIGAGDADVVFVTDVARLARSPARLAGILAAIERSGARLLTTTEAA
jgi:DNA invertase Pin-like site-specific DNA recombinase